MSTGRNDPCPCGSGKKYKKCCLPQRAVISLVAVRSDNLFRELWEKFLDFMASTASSDAVGKGLAYFFAAPIDEEDAEEMGEFAMDWVAFVYRTDRGTTLCEQFAASGKRLTDQEREVLRDWSLSAPGFFRVEDVAEEEYQLHRLPDGKRFSVRAPKMKLSAGDTLSAWLLPVHSEYRFGHLVKNVDREEVGPLMHLVEIEMELLRRQRPAATWEELYREHWPRLTDAFSMAVAGGESALRITLAPGPSVLAESPEPSAQSARWREVDRMILQGMESLEDWFDPCDSPGLLRLWRDGALALRPRAVRPVSWAAAVLYLYLRDILGEGVTQAEVAEQLGVSVSTVGSHSRELAGALQPRLLDPRYVDLMDPVFRMHWRMECLGAMKVDCDPLAMSTAEQTLMEKALRRLDPWWVEEQPAGPVRQAEELIDQAWEASGSRRVQLAKKALALWPDAADAYVILGQSAEAKGDLKEALRQYEAGVEAGQRALGADFFAENVGHFYGILESRPYMRARAGLAGCLWALGQREAAVAHYEEMLWLNPGDNQGIRYLLAASYLMMGEDDRLGRLLTKHADEGSAAISFTRALWQYRWSGPGKIADQLLAKAVAQNPHVAAYLLGEKRLPAEPPDYIDFGGDLEAVDYAWEFGQGWRQTEGALDWLRSRVR